ncbi:ParB/RepB/Spo0J family partition protein [Streptomyces monomycini]|uniref:ParB/RepB/Spo0J family partition protein n=1 Tax=Streptomyces monomycini TaxID=371720 RepID=UPI000A877A63|nr:ParB/RepB/Spo0J family partition protein [Streptomyces monomycini]
MQDLGNVREPGPAEDSLHLVSLKELRSSNDSPRSGGLNREHVELLLASGASLPPILVHRPTMRVLDGMHRLQVAVQRGDRTIRCTFFDGSEADVFVLAVESNVRHGLPLSLEERTAAATRIVRSHPHLSDRSVARVSGLSPKTVAAVRRRSSEEIPQSNARIGNDGRTRPLDMSELRKEAARVMTDHPGMPLREVATTVGISLGTAHDVRERLRSGRDPVPVRYREVSAPASKRKNAAGRPTPQLGDRKPAGKTTNGQPLQDISELHRTLKKDPSIRFTEMGRTLLRLFDAQELLMEAGGHLVDGVPPHWAEMVAELADGCADSWREFADQVRRIVVSHDQQASG